MSGVAQEKKTAPAASCGVNGARLYLSGEGQEVASDRSRDGARHARGRQMPRRAIPLGRADQPGRSGQRAVRFLMGDARPFLVEGHGPASRPARHDLPAAAGRSRPAHPDRRGAVGREDLRSAPRDHLRHRLRRGAPLRRDRVDPGLAPGGPGALRPAAPGAGRRHDRRRGGRAGRRAPGGPAAPSAHPALPVLGSRLRPHDHRPRPGRGAVRRAPGRPGGCGHHGAGPDAVRAAHWVLARRRGHGAAACAAVQGARVHAAAGPRRGARHPGRHRLPRPVRGGRGRPAAAADPGRARDGAPHGAAALLPAGKAGR